MSGIEVVLAGAALASTGLAVHQAIQAHDNAPDPPGRGDNEIQNAARRARKAASERVGRQSTILGGAVDAAQGLKFGGGS